MRKLALLSFIGLACTLSCKQSDITGKEPWKSVLEEQFNDPQVNQILLVDYIKESKAEAWFFVKEAEGWRLDRKGDAHVGENGIGKQREGDMKTPVGTFGMRGAFGIKPNPGSKMEYIDVTENVWACDDDCEYYNTIIQVDTTSHQCTGEHMIEYVPDYNYGMYIDYNPDRIYPLGCAIFLHCKGLGNCTAGCVAVDEDFMKYMLEVCDPGFKIVIN